MPVRKLTASVLCAGSMLTPIAAAQDGGAPVNAGQAQPEQAQPEEMITFPDFSAPVELRVLVDFAASQLGINMDIEGNLSGTVALNAPISFPKSQLLTIVNALLEQRGFAITYDELTTFYRVGPKGTVGASLAPWPAVRTTSPSMISPPSPSAPGPRPVAAAGTSRCPYCF